MSKYSHKIHALIYAVFSLGLLYFLHLLPVNQLFIDPFSEAIKHHDIVDITFSKFRDHNAPGLFDARIVIVNSGVTDREKIAGAIRLADKMEAGAIGLDLLFDSTLQNRKDSLLQTAIQEAQDKLVMGYSLGEISPRGEFIAGMQSHTFFRKGLQEGYVNLGTNDGFSVRAFNPYKQEEGQTKTAFATVLAQMMDSSLANDLKKRNYNSEWINFRRVQPGASSMKFPVNSKKTVSYILVDIEKFLADSAQYNISFLKDKIVLIGFCGENETAFSMKDRYFTPLNEQYTGRSLPDMHGVVIHANIISMLLDRDFINDAGENAIYLISFLIFYFNFFFFTRIHHRYHLLQRLTIRMFQILEFIFFFSLCVVLLAFFNLKLGFFIIATSIILSYELFLIYDRKMVDSVEARIYKIKKMLSKR